MSLGSRGWPDNRPLLRNSIAANTRGPSITHGQKEVNSSTTIATSSTNAVAKSTNSNSHDAVNPTIRPVTALATVRTRASNGRGGPSASRLAGSRHVQKWPGLRG